MTIKISNAEGKKIQFQNENANKINSDIKKEGDNVALENVEEFRSKQVIGPEVYKTQIR